MPSSSLMQTTPADNWYPSIATPTRDAELLRNSAQAEVLDFLSRRAINAAFFAGMIYDNGLESPLNRGNFYGYRNTLGQLEGVALIGHATVVEALSDEAVRAFAAVTQRCTTVHMIMCEENQIEKFWEFYAPAGQEMRRACRQLLMELRWPANTSAGVAKIRPATVSDLDLLIPIHAEMALEESGVDPRLQDAKGFAERYARRIALGRTWILTDADKLLFKADVASASPQTTYLEGVWVKPEIRNHGFGQSCMAQLARMLMWRAKSVCLFVNDENDEAQQFYRRAGYHLRTVYDTIFVT